MNNIASEIAVFSLQDLRKLGISFSRQHLLRLERGDRFPKRVYLSPKKPTWRASEINAWLKSRTSDRGAA